MVSIVQHRRRFAGAAGAPAAAGSLEGELAINFSQTGTPELWVFGGATTGTAPANKGWLRANPPGVAPNVRGVTAVAGGADVQTSWNADNITVAPGDVVIYTYQGTAYVYTGPTGAPANTATAANFTSLGAATSFATAADVRTGTNTTLAINPKVLADALGTLMGVGGTAANPNAPGGAQTAATGVPGDAGRVVQLDATGKIPPAFLTIQGLTFAAQDLAIAPTGTNGTHVNGKIVVHTGADGATINGGFTPVANGVTTVNDGDMLLSDGTNWHHIENRVDLTNVVTKSGAQALQADWVGTMAVPATAGMVVRLDGTDNQKSQIKNFDLDTCTLDGGTF